MTTQHTPGPWIRTAGQRFRHDQSAGVTGPNGTYVACALDMNRHDRDAEVEANARLIAAAPELLAACDAQAALIRDLLNLIDPERRALIRQRLVAVSDQVYAALAKTRADQP